ncbi:MAG: CDP-diacylglycerol--glycerol-3-phosphate 3-phosphatidyltransferase [Pseudomonadota bacterium]|jgi:CDP-diacylglycerol--glycerol-3-phosphate 3-phosphatidyltransferase
MKALPNILSTFRIFLTLAMFAALVAIGAGRDPGGQLAAFAFWAFVIAAVTDFLDGWLARRFDAVTVWGTILDPIGDKILVCGAVVGLMAAGAGPAFALPAGLILFREFAVSALREVGAARGLKLPVTRLAKWKTAVQLVALAVVLGVGVLPGLPPQAPGVLMWFAALLTLWTGGEYLLQTRKGLAAQD